MTTKRAGTGSIIGPPEKEMKPMSERVAQKAGAVKVLQSQGLDPDWVIFDVLASRPDFGIQGRLFVSSDTQVIYLDTGTAWLEVGNAGGAGTDTTAIHDNESAEINAITEKAIPIDADLLLIEDSADSNNKKMVQVGNLPSAGTKEFIVYPKLASGPLAGTPDVVGDFPADRMGGSEETQFVFFIPNDFSSVTSIEVMIIPDTTETIGYDLTSDYGAVGEVYNFNSESSLTQTLAVTINVITEIDVSGVFSSVAAGDYCGLRLISNTSDLEVVALRFKYQ